jgi:predicted HicB family RNase H-like nuclease
MTNKTGKRLVLNIDAKLHSEIKMNAAERGISITRYVLQAVFSRIQQDNKYN